MEITLIIVGGIVITTIVGSAFSYFSTKKAGAEKGLEDRIKVLEGKVNTMSEASLQKDERIVKLENDLAFLNRLIEDKTK